MTELNNTFAIAGTGLKAQNARMKAIAENIANANSTASAPGQNPYQRQVVTFKSEFDRALGAYKVKVAGVQSDKSEFIRKYDPSHPSADKDGYVMMPNVNPLVEMMDMGDATRAYQANLNVIDAGRNMTLHTIQLLQ